MSTACHPRSCASLRQQGWALLRLLLLAWLLLGGAAQAQLGGHTIGVVYSVADDQQSGELARMIAAVESSPDVQVWRIAVSAGGAQTLLAQAPRRPEPLKVAMNGPPGIAVIYPDIGEPYRSVFAQIISGIEEKARTRVASFPVGNSLDAQELAGELRRQDIRVVIALGRHGLKATSGLERDVSVLASGVFSAPEATARGISVFSLAPDPALLFARLKIIQPATRRVLVVYDPRHNDWLIELAREAARSQGIELVAREAGDLKAAVRLYEELLAAAESRVDALWLPQDVTTVDETTVVPLVLQEGWNRNLTVFSSSIGHVRRGALFSLYPDNIALGRSLAASALGQGSPPKGVTPLREVLLAVNVRTAGHLGINPTPRELQGIDRVFPEP